MKMYGVLIGLSFLVAWIFYDSWWGIFSVVFLYYPFKIIYTENANADKKIKMQKDYKDMLQILITYMQTGYSLENAFLNTEKELANIVGTDNYLVLQLKHMNHRVHMNMPIEKSFEIMSQNIDIEESMEFSEIVSISKRLGGNYNKNIRTAAEKLEDKITLAQEIETMMAEKKYEMKVMIIMPVVIITYIKFASTDFVGGLYHNFMGIIIMTVCLIIYMLMILWANKIVSIDV